jgi:hypothetical protein
MRLSAWRAAAPRKDAVTARVAAVIDPVLAAFGSEPDPHCWVAWGDEPAMRYSILVPTDPGLIHCFVRVNVSGEGPRATTKLVRWQRVSVGELAVEAQAGHRLLSFQIEGQVLRGVDAEADRVAAFALRVIAAIDGRPLPPVEEPSRGRGGRRGTSSAAKRPTTAGRPAGGRRPPAAKSAAAKAAAGSAKTAVTARRATAD